MERIIDIGIRDDGDEKLVLGHSRRGERKTTVCNEIFKGCPEIIRQLTMVKVCFYFISRMGWMGGSELWNIGYSDCKSL